MPLLPPLRIPNAGCMWRDRTWDCCSMYWLSGMPTHIHISSQFFFIELKFLLPCNMYYSIWGLKEPYSAGWPTWWQCHRLPGPLLINHRLQVSSFSPTWHTHSPLLVHVVYEYDTCTKSRLTPRSRQHRVVVTPFFVRLCSIFLHRGVICQT